MIENLTELPGTGADLIACVFDALPLAAFVVDPDFHIVDFNLAGARLLERLPHATLRLRGCDRPHCVHTIETDEDGGDQPCRDCIVNNFVRDIFEGIQAFRKIGRLRLNTAGKPAYADFLITVVPVEEDSIPLSLLMVDDVAELTASLASFSPDSKARAKAPARRMGSS